MDKEHMRDLLTLVHLHSEDRLDDKDVIEIADRFDINLFDTSLVEIQFKAIGKILSRVREFVDD